MAASWVLWIFSLMNAKEISLKEKKVTEQTDELDEKGRDESADDPDSERD